MTTPTDVEILLFLNEREMAYSQRMIDTHPNPDFVSIAKSINRDHIKTIRDALEKWGNVTPEQLAQDPLRFPPDAL